MRLASIILLAAVTPAAAGPLADALARHSPADVATLRAQLSDVGARCTLGAVYARRNDLPRAALYLAGCDDAELPADVSAEIARTSRDLKRTLRDSDLAVIEVITYPEHMTGEIDALPGDTFTTPATLYVKPGTHVVHANHDGAVWKNTITVAAHSRAPVILGEQPRTTTPAKPKDHKIDFTDEHGADTATSGPPPAIKHGTMIKGKLGAGLTAKPRGDDPNGLQDPFAIAAREARPRAPRPFWLGLRIAGGMFDDGATRARPGIAIAGATRIPLAGRTFLAGRLDWSRRGGDTGSGLDVLGASAGAGHTVVDAREVGIAVIAQLRGDLRLTSSRGQDPAMTTAVNRAGLAAAAGVELVLPRSPFSAGLRFEQGLTPIVDGARDRAMLLELGVDWR